MIWALIKKMILAIPVLLSVTLIVFLLLRSLPGDPAQIYLGPEATQQEIEELQARMGLDRPVHLQYLDFLGDLSRGDLGFSLRTGRPVLQELFSRVGLTSQLALYTVLAASISGVGLGIYAAVNPRLTPIMLFISMLGISTPVYWLGLLLILIFSVSLGWFPPGGSSGWRSLVLPVLTLTLSTASSLFRLTLDDYQEINKQDYMRTAKAKGLSVFKIHAKHGLRNALIPILAFVALEFGSLLGGAVLTESVFTLNGVGRYLVIAISQRDYPVVQGAILLLAVSFVLLNLVVDLVYLFIDPRVRS